MRISDWSSDVCSSELFHAPARGAEARGAGHRVDEPEEHEVIMAETQTLSDLKDLGQAADAVTEAPIREQELDQHGRAYGTGRRKEDRKSVEQVTNVSVRVDLGGRRHSQKKQTR